jgi:UDP-2,3-diacylglucosamine hydrolase
MHGDTLCIEDKAYLKFRKKARNKFFQWLFLLKSLKKRKLIAQQYREASQQYISTAPEHIMDVTPSEVERIMLKHRVDLLIHGHTHRQAIHSFKIDGKKFERVVLGAWHQKGNAFVFEKETQRFIVIE